MWTRCSFPKGPQVVRRADVDFVVHDGRGCYQSFLEFRAPQNVGFLPVRSGTEMNRWLLALGDARAARSAKLRPISRGDCEGCRAKSAEAQDCDKPGFPHHYAASGT